MHEPQQRPRGSALRKHGPNLSQRRLRWLRRNVLRFGLLRRQRLRDQHPKCDRVRDRCCGRGLWILRCPDCRRGERHLRQQRVRCVMRQLHPNSVRKRVRQLHGRTGLHCELESVRLPFGDARLQWELRFAFAVEQLWDVLHEGLPRTDERSDRRRGLQRFVLHAFVQQRHVHQLQRRVRRPADGPQRLRRVHEPLPHVAGDVSSALYLQRRVV